jgi:hypothetical protein
LRAREPHPLRRALRAPATQSAAISSQRRNAITDAVQKVAPSVVTVQTEVIQRVAASPADFFFGTQSGQQVQAGIGSGFIVREDGVIVTNAHVVSGATKISVALRDGTSYPAKLVGIDEQNDLAVLKIDAKKLPVAALGTSRDLLIGEWAIAIGNPFGFILGNTEPCDRTKPYGARRGSGRLRGHDPDRRRDQSRQLRRPARERTRRSRRRQQFDLFAERRQRRPGVRHSHRPGAARDGRPAAARQGSQAVDRREDGVPAADGSHARCAQLRRADP